MSRLHGSTVAAEITSIENVASEVTRVTITLDWTKADQIDMKPPPLFAVFGDNFLELAGDDRADDEGCWNVPPESITMQLLRAAWYTAQIDAK